MAGPFDNATSQDIADLIRAYPLAWVVSHGSGGFAATPLPLLVDLGEDGTVVRLVGHFARSNPQVAAIEQDPRVLILFQGPQAYISPSWISDRTWGPTWNYATVQIEADVRFLPDEADNALGRLVEAMEAGRPNAWSIAEMGERYQRLRQGIIAFHADVRSVRARFKLGQDERPAVFAEILAGSGDDALTAWMRRLNPEKSA